MINTPPAATIVITASRIADEQATTPASVTLIGPDRIVRLGPALVGDLLRLAPSVAVSSSGPSGSLTDVRIRGAEANHTLLFIDGIRANDPAAGNAPRFELLNADLASQVEIVRGPQSALWGSEAIGGVVAVTGASPGRGESLLDTEAGSFGMRRAAARTGFGSAERGLTIGLAGQRAGGIDSFSGQGDRDGYRNLAARIAGTYRIGGDVAVGGSGFALHGTSAFDGYDPLTFARADTADRSRNRLAAGRLFATIGSRDARFVTASGSLLRSANRNLLGDEPLNRTAAGRRTILVEGGTRIGRHRFLVAAESEAERFAARDVVYGGATDQDRSRRHRSLTLEYRMTGLGPLSTDLSLRRDLFSRFKDATSVRAAALIALGHGLSVSATYGEGLAQPTFFDLYGFFPGSFAGNPSLRPETSRGGEVALRFRQGPLAASATYYRQGLRREIVDLFAFPLSTTVNASGKSRRQGVELEADYAPSAALHLSATYAFLDASEPDVGGGQVKEQRRPKHSGSVGVDGARGKLSYGAAMTYSGVHLDTDFDVYPARRVRLHAYWLASARIGYRLTDAVELHLRVANALGADYQDVLGYRTEGRSVHAGIRLAVGG